LIDYFWGRRPDGIAINEALQIRTLDFKLSSDRDKGILEVEKAKANEQHKEISDRGILGAKHPLPRCPHQSGCSEDALHRATPI